MISDLKIHYNGQELTEYLDLTSEPIGRNLPDRENQIVSKGSGDGSHYITGRFKEKEITLEIYVSEHSITYVKNQLINMINVDGPKPLTFSDRPNESWNAIIDGESDLVRSIDSLKEGAGTLTFLIPEGFARSVKSKEFELTTVGTDKIFKIDNGGTYKSRPSFEFEVLKDTDGFGLVTDNQVLQLGTIDQVDLNQTAAQSIIWKDDLEPISKPKWQSNIAKPNFSTSDDRPSKVMGSVSWINSGLVPTNFGSIDTTAPGYWHGPSESRYIGQQLDNWDLYSRITFRPTPKNVTGKKRIEQQGLLEVNMYDEDNQLVCGFHFKDNTQASDLIEYSIYLSGVQVYKNSMPRAFHTEDGGFYGFLWIRKIGNKFNVELVKTIGAKQTWRKNLNFTNEDAARLKGNRVDYWMSQWGTRPTMDMRISYSTLFKTNVENEEDIPLKFYEGDVVLIDGDTGKVFINGGERADYFIIGSKFIECQRGMTDVYLMSDDGAVTGKAILEEKFL
nr:MAG TPA: distal tail protein [Caudoviricetes sp.]